MTSRGSKIGWVLVIALMVLAALGVWLVPKLRQTDPIPAEKIVAVERGDIARSVVAVGHVEPLSKVEVKSKANGIIQALLVDVGDEVQEGQTLAELDKENLEAQVREARRRWTGSQANLKSPRRRRPRRASRPPTRSSSSSGATTNASSAGGGQDRLAAGAGRSREGSSRQLNRQATARGRRAKRRRAGGPGPRPRGRRRGRPGSRRGEPPSRHHPLAHPGIVLTRDTEVGDAVSSILNLGSAATLIMTLGDVSSVYVKGQVDEARRGQDPHRAARAHHGRVFPGEPSRAR